MSIIGRLYLFIIFITCRVLYLLSNIFILFELHLLVWLLQQFFYILIIFQSDCTFLRKYIQLYSLVSIISDKSYDLVKNKQSLKKGLKLHFYMQEQDHKQPTCQ